MKLKPIIEIPLEVPLKPKVYPNADRFGHLPAWGINARYVDGLVIRNYQLKANPVDQRKPVIVENCEIDEEGWNVE